MVMRLTASIIIAVLAATCSVEAQFTEVDIASQANANIQTYSFGNNYQLGGTTLTVAGVPFGLSELNSDPLSTGVVQADGPYDYTFSVPAGTQATALYSLVNTAFGSFGVDEGSLVVNGTHGETATLDLIEGDNVRDHNNDGFVNSLSDSTVVPTYFEGGAPTTDGDIQTRLDRQVLVLPASFNGDTIASITFEGDANGGNGEAFLAGLTLSDAVPDGSLPLPLTAGVFMAILATAAISRKEVRVARVRVSAPSSR
jgi:hypothetical protein